MKVRYFLVAALSFPLAVCQPAIGQESGKIKEAFAAGFNAGKEKGLEEGRALCTQTLPLLVQQLRSNGGNGSIGTITKKTELQQLQASLEELTAKMRQLESAQQLKDPG